MALKIEWTARADQQLRDLRKRGQTWHTIAAQLRVGRSAAIERARGLGIPPNPQPPPRPASLRRALDAPRADRPCIPAGHPLSWSAITSGTVLDGEPYPYPVFL